MAEESGQDQGEKTEDPSQHRIDEFRKKGEVASSKELTSVLVLSAGFLTLGITVTFVYETLSQYIEWLYLIDVKKAYTQEARDLIIDRSLRVILKTAGPICFMVLLMGIVGNIIQFGFLFSPEVLSFKPERINPLAGFKRLFSMRSLVEAIKGVFKFIIILSIVYYFMKDDIKTYSGFFHVEFIQAFMHAKFLLLKIGFSIVLGLVVVALGDYAYQKFAYTKKLKQTKDAAKRELKEQEGNPEVKQRVRSIQREMSQRRMMADISKSDVIVTNPTHLSVAIRYDKKTMVSPEVIGKGADHLALRIRKIAKEHNIPIVENVPLARSLYKTVDVGKSVPRGLYKAVAEVLAFVYKLKKKEKALS